jgi:hypothetical protein
MSLRLIPLNRDEANEAVARWHRHHRPVHAHKFAIGVTDDCRLCGAAIVGNPVSRFTDRKSVCEVLRVATDGTKNACSILYAACARAARAMGYRKIQTFILAAEDGTSLRAAGWTFEGITAPGTHGWVSRPGRRRPLGLLALPKHRYVKELSDAR